MKFKDRIRKPDLIEVKKAIDLINNQNKIHAFHNEQLKLSRLSKIIDSKVISIGLYKSMKSAIEIANSPKYPIDLIETMSNLTAQIENSENMKQIRLQAELIVESFKKMQEALSLPFKEMQDSIEKFRKAYSDVHKELAIHTWYLPIDLELGEIKAINTASKQGRSEELDKILLKWFKRNKIKVKERLITENTDRTHLIEEGFRAIQNKMWHSAICIFISQSDGIFGGNLFLTNWKSGEKIKLKNFLREKGFNTWEELVMSAVNTKLIIDKKSDDSEDSNRVLNRHGILHGRFLNYGSEMNAYKALSLLTFVSNLMHKARMENNAKNKSNLIPNIV